MSDRKPATTHVPAPAQSAVATPPHPPDAGVRTLDPLRPETVLDLARLAGLPLDDADQAVRIAAGASAAIVAVTRGIREPLFDLEPGDYRATLERLASPLAGGPGG